MKDLILKKSELQIEYNWTDQRIYMHKYDINDFYNHQHPLGFWAGPHAEELLFNYIKNFGDRFLKFHFSKTKRGLNTREMVEDNYQDMQLKRYKKAMKSVPLISISFETPSNIKDLRYSLILII